MPPRFTYWTILLDGKPTAFRARTGEELLPTLRQLQVRHPEAVMLWFARGRLWSSPEEERAAAHARRADRERRHPDWRPGGEHRDPRDRFKVPRDEKRRRFATKLRRERDAGAPPEPAKGKAAGSYGRRGPSARPPGGQGGRGPAGGDRGAGPGGRRGQPSSGSRGGPRGWNRDRGGRGRGNGGGGRGGRGGK